MQFYHKKQYYFDILLRTEIQLLILYTKLDLIKNILKKMKQGLQNRGNTCFLNSAMQNMFAAKNFRKHVINHSQKYPSDKFIKLIGDIFKGMLDGPQSMQLSQNLDNLTWQLEQMDESYTQGIQHDAMNFVFKLLERIRRQSQELDEYFKIQYEQRCSTNSQKCDIIHLHDIYILNEEQNCGKCKNPKEVVVVKPSEYLILIKGNEKIKEQKDFKSKNASTIKYIAISNCVYYGSGKSGHYIANRRSLNEYWQNFNDSRVTTLANADPFEQGTVLFGVYEIKDKQQLSKQVDYDKVQESFKNIDKQKQIQLNQAYFVNILTLFKKDSSGAILKALRDLYFKVIHNNQIKFEVINNVKYFYAKHTSPLETASKNLLKICYTIQDQILNQALSEYDLLNDTRTFVRKQNIAGFQHFDIKEDYVNLNIDGCPLVKIALSKQIETPKPKQQKIENKQKEAIQSFEKSPKLTPAKQTTQIQKNRQSTPQRNQSITKFRIDVQVVDTNQNILSTSDCLTVQIDKYQIKYTQCDKPYKNYQQISGRKVLVIDLPKNIKLNIFYRLCFK